MHAFLIDIFQLTEISIRLSGLFLVESENQRHYNDYRTVMSNENNGLRDLLAKARAIHFAMSHDQLTYERAKLLTKPILRSVNDYVMLISKQHNVKKPRLIKFHDLGRNL